MRIAVALVAGAATFGCGRLGFDRSDGARDGGIDALPSDDARIDPDTDASMDGPTDAMSDADAADVAPDRDDGSRSPPLNVAWTSTFASDGVDDPSVAFDSMGDVILFGASSNPIDFGGGPRGRVGDFFFLAKLTSAGDHVWSLAYDTNAWEWLDLALGPDDSIYVTSGFAGTIDFGTTSVTGGAITGFAAGFDSFGTNRWSQLLGGQYVSPYAVAISGDTVYVTGQGDGLEWNFGGGPLPRVSESLDAALAAYAASDGTHRWSKRLGNPQFPVGENSSMEGIAVLPAADGTAWFTGHYGDSVDFGGETLESIDTSHDVFVARYDASGAIVAVRSAGTANEEKVTAAAPTSTGGLIVAGTVQAPGCCSIPIDAAFVRAFDETGAVSWTFDLDAAITVRAIATAPGTVYVGATFAGSVTIGDDVLTSVDGMDDYVVVSLNDAGEYTSATQLGGAPSEVLSDVAVGPDGTVVITGFVTEGAVFGGPSMFVTTLGP